MTSRKGIPSKRHIANAARPDLHDLQVADARWQAVLAIARDAIVAIDSEACIALFNPAAEQIFGYRAAEVLGQNVSLLMPAPYRDEHDEYLRRYQRTGEARAIGRIRAVEGQRKSGEVFPIELSVSEVRLGGDVMFIAILRDISDRLAGEQARAAAERELRELQRAAQERARLADIGAITAKIVHDLGNPLAALSMQAQLILRRARRGDFHPVAPVREPAEQILRTLRRLERLIHEFTDFAREQKLEVRAIPVGRFLASCVDLWQALATERGITLTLAPVERVPDLCADEVMLRRVLDNLLKNAIEAVDRGPGTVVVSATIPTPGKIRIAVDDDGPGVQENIDVFRLFETTKSEGTGIGLAVAKQLVAAHGGVIEYLPRSPHGTTFRLELPLDGPTSQKDYGPAS